MKYIHVVISNERWAAKKATRGEQPNSIAFYVNGNYIVCERRYICDGSVAVGRFRSSFSMLVMEYMIRPIDTNISALFILTTIVAQHVNLQPICIRAYIFMWAIVVEGVGTRRAKLMQQAGEELAGVGWRRIDHEVWYEEVAEIWWVDGVGGGGEKYVGRTESFEGELNECKGKLPCSVNKWK